MPKPRQTCTECSIRRQKCDKGTPCGRCIKRGVADRCTRHWSIQRDNHVRARSSPQTSIDRSATSARRFTENGPDVLLSPLPIPAATAESSAEPTIRFNVAADSYREGHPQSRHFVSTHAQFNGLLNTSQSRLAHLQMLVPSINQVWKLVNFHEKRLLWYHGCYHGPSFNHQLDSRIREQGLQDDAVLKLRYDDLQWGSLLFAVIASSLVCASHQLASSWGFEADEVEVLSQKWYDASIACLDLADYTSYHELFAVQAICTLTMCAHSLGHSNKQYVLLGAALRIAQSLGLHEFGLTKERITASSSAADREAVLKKEVGRRLWSQLCVQDWFSIPFAKVHNIHRRQFIAIKPSNRDYITMEEVPENEPTYVSYGNYLYEIAGLIADLHENLRRCNTEYTRYQQIMKIDTAMRELATKGRPRYFDATVEIDESWPWYIRWARRSLTICFAHKIIVIHRTFLNRSFEDDMFSYTRRTCIAAAKTILNEAQQQQREDEPVIWIDQAFCIAAGIVLALDIMHRREDETEIKTHRELIDGCIYMLQQYSCSLLASRGVRLLQSLLGMSGTYNASISPTFGGSLYDARTILRRVHRGAESSTSRLPPGTGLELLSDSGPTRQESLFESALDTSTTCEYGYDNFAEMFPPQTGFSNSFLFEELLGLELV